MPNPLDIAGGFGPNDELFDVFEELWTWEDPYAVIARCEEIDQDEGWSLGTALEQYLAHVTNTH